MQATLRQRFATSLLVALPVVVWLLLCRRLQPDWQLNPQYSHGWFVPFLVLLLWNRRWPDRPTSNLAKPHSLPWPLILVLLTAALLPTQLLLQANPDWRAPYWLWAILAWGITLTCLAHRGGLPWVRHFAAALSLMFFAIPWPSPLEQQVNTWLLGGVVMTTSEILNLLGMAVARSGNTLVFAQGQLGVEDACSGIRSLHGSLMIAYILGELGRWTWPWRIGLLALAILDAFALNSLRAIILGWKAVLHGTEKADQWHDPIGISITILTLSLLLLTYLIVERKLSHSTHTNAQNLNRVPGPIAIWGVASSALMLSGTVIASTIWFDTHTDASNIKELVIKWDAIGLPIQREEIPYRARTQLRYSKGSSRSWRTTTGSKVTAYWFRWDRDRISLFNAVHRPEVCLPSVGLQWIESTEPVSVTTSDGAILQFQGHQFTSLGRPIFVWFGVWDQHLSAIELEGTSMNRLRNTWERKRAQSRQSIELILSGHRTWDEAKNFLHQWSATTIAVDIKSDSH